MKRTPIPRNFLWSESLRSSDQTIWAAQGMKRPLAFRTKGISALEFNCFDRRMNAPPRLRFSVVPSTRSVGAWIATGHLTLALEWRRLSTFIIFCERQFVEGFFLVNIQEVCYCNQIYRNGKRKCNQRKPRLTSPVKFNKGNLRLGLESKYLNELASE